ERIVLIDPGVVARLCAVVADAMETGAGIFIERPAFGAVIAGGLRSVQWTFALSPVEACQMAARERRPHDTLLVDVSAADAEAGRRDIIDFRERRLGRIWTRSDPYDRAR